MDADLIGESASTQSENAAKREDHIHVHRIQTIRVLLQLLSSYSGNEESHLGF